VILEKKLINYQKHLVLANSHYTATEIQRFSSKKAKVLYPPLSSVISEIGRQTNKTPQEDLVVTVSRLDSNKLLERIPRVAAKTDRNTKFAVVGRLYNQQVLDHLEATVKKLGVSDRVMFYPNASSKQKIDLLQRAKIYLHTMVGEHFGISIVEAMALGCIPIVHDSGGMREFVPAQYRYVTVEQAAEKITSELSVWSKSNAEEMKEIASQFSYENFSKRFLGFFDAYFGQK
jgi:glycosyltransferase involved in cell wall biosynthesis